MMVVVSYDVSTQNSAGQRRLRRVAKACLNHGVRVQKSVFECDMDPAMWTELRHILHEIMNPQEDSLRVYFLGSNWRRRVEHYGANPPLDVLGDSLIV